MMIDWRFIDDWLMIDWLMIDWLLFDDRLMIDWWFFFMIDWWLIDDWLMINGMVFSQFWLCHVILDCTTGLLNFTQRVWHWLPWPCSSCDGLDRPIKTVVLQGLWWSCSFAI